MLRSPHDREIRRLAQLQPLARISGELFVRSAALPVAFVTASAVIARIGDASLAARGRPPLAHMTAGRSRGRP